VNTVESVIAVFSERKVAITIGKLAASPTATAALPSFAAVA